MDTDVVSYFLKQHPLADYFRPFFINRTLAISFMTVAELYFWAYKQSWGQSRILDLENKIKNYVVLPYDYLMCMKWADVRNQCEAIGLPATESDYWVAATALRYDCALATNNGRHYQGINNLEIISPTLI